MSEPRPKFSWPLLGTFLTMNFLVVAIGIVFFVTVIVSVLFVGFAGLLSISLVFPVGWFFYWNFHLRMFHGDEVFLLDPGRCVMGEDIRDRMPLPIFCRRRGIHPLVYRIPEMIGSGLPAVGMIATFVAVALIV